MTNSHRKIALAAGLLLTLVLPAIAAAMGMHHLEQSLALMRQNIYDEAQSHHSGLATKYFLAAAASCVGGVIILAQVVLLFRADKKRETAPVA